MSLVDTLQSESIRLASGASELRDRIEVLQKNGLSAQTSVDALIATCKELGRLADAIQRLLEQNRGDSQRRPPSGIKAKQSKKKASTRRVAPAKSRGK
jgi:hypothetical protein